MKFCHMGLVKLCVRVTGAVAMSLRSKKFAISTGTATVLFIEARFDIVRDQNRLYST